MAPLNRISLPDIYNTAQHHDVYTSSLVFTKSALSLLIRCCEQFLKAMKLCKAIQPAGENPPRAAKTDLSRPVPRMRRGVIRPTSPCPSLTSRKFPSARRALGSPPPRPGECRGTPWDLPSGNSSTQHYQTPLSSGLSINISHLSDSKQIRGEKLRDLERYQSGQP